MALLVLGELKEFANGKMRAFRLGGREIAVARVGERLYAFANQCTHQQEYLTDGFLEGQRVVCAYHEATYDLATGAVVYGPAFDDLAVFPLRTQGDLLQIEWPEELPADAVFPVNHDDDEGRLDRQIMT